MHEIRVERTLEAPAEHVFELISDHAGYRRFRGITSAKLVKERAEEKNGLGAVRRIASGPNWYGALGVATLSRGFNSMLSEIERSYKA